MSHQPGKSVIDELIEIRFAFEQTYGKSPAVMSGETHDLTALSRSLEGIFTQWRGTPESALGRSVGTLYGIPIFVRSRRVPPGLLRLYGPEGTLVYEITGIG